MKFTPRLIEVLENDFCQNTTVELEDLLRVQCPLHHALHMGDSKSRTPEEALLEIAQPLMRDKVQDYFIETFGSEFTPVHVRSVGGIRFEALGAYKGTLIDFSMVPKRTWSASKPTNKALLSAALKAAVLGFDKVVLVWMEQNTQKWSFWEVLGDYTIQLPKLKEYIRNIECAERDQVGRKNVSCKRCPFNEKGCSEAIRTDTSKGFSLRGLSYEPAVRIKKKLETYLWSLNKEKNKRATHCFHPSEFSITSCDRRLAYSLKGVTRKSSVDAALRRVFHYGHCIHDTVQMLLGYSSTFQAEVPVRNRPLSIYGHCDGVDGKDGVEIKSESTLGHAKRSSASKDHRKQATIYGRAGTFQLDTVSYIYVDKDIGTIKEFEVPVDNALWHEQASRAETILAAVKSGVLPERVTKEYVCYDCPFKYHCKPDPKEERPAFLGRIKR